MLKYGWVVLTSFLYAGFVHAGEMGSTQRDFHGLLMLSGGPVWAEAGKQQTMTLTTQPVAQNMYVPARNVSTFGSGSLFLAIEHLSWNSTRVALGLAVTGSGQATVRGSVLQEGDATFDNFEYDYNINQVRLGLKGRVVATDFYMLRSFKRIMPYGSAEIALAWNRSYGYAMRPKIDTAVLQPPFTPNTVTALSYAFAAGLQTNVREHVDVAIGYEIANWGNSHLGLAHAQTTTTKFGLSSLYASEFQFSVIYTA